ncbi:CUB and zona pellucida-like domain-containing protein 1 [Thalassophryne amazonica]|uniref:CUB and zona pellucida-like domain-containing protein 1 n=1 Tax=Thalassophryne amazonica TaxID=390379 RepID=UPI001470E07A|nr:CUB and zona pellucida-like domain-containing protein 1 [Thalassophryne amazonica]
MRVELERSKLPGLRDDQLQLSDPGNTVCSLQTHSNSTHVVAVVPLNACGTQIEEDDDNLIFKNELTTVETAGSLITRKHMFEVQFYCQYPKRGNVTLSFTVHRKNVTIWERGFGMFTYQSEFYPNDQFQIRIDPNSYPLEFEIGTLIHMQIEAVSTVNNTELFVESCRASPYDNPNYPSTYVIIENGCQVDPTIKIHPPAHNKQFRFSMEAFKFIGLHDLVYISCSVMMCEAGNLDTRCSQGCIKSNSTNSRPKREAAIQTARHFVSQGPLRLRRSSERAQSPVTNLNLNLVFIAGCFLAVVGMISAAVVHKSRTPKIKYQLLPAAEN